MKKFTPIVDIVEGAVKKLHVKNGVEETQPTTPESKFQYQRAYALSRDLRGQLARYSVDQFKEIESQNVLVSVKSLISIRPRAHKVFHSNRASLTLTKSLIPLPPPMHSPNLRSRAQRHHAYRT